MMIVGGCMCGSPGCRYCGQVITPYVPYGGTTTTIQLGVQEVWAVRDHYGVTLFRSELEAYRHAYRTLCHEPFKVRFGEHIAVVDHVDDQQAAAMAEDWDEDIAIANEVK